MVHEDRAAVFTGTFFETGQSITVCAECLIDFAKALASPPPGEEPIDAELESDTEPPEIEYPGPTPDAEPPSSGSPESSPDATTPDHVEAESDVIRVGGHRFQDNGAVVDESASTPSE